MTARRPLVAWAGGLGSIRVVALVLGALTGLHEATPARAASPAADLTVPTTKVLAIGSWTLKATPDLWRPIVPTEMRQTARLYLAGKIDQWYVKPDQSGVVFIMNVTTVSEARDLLDKLPLGQAALMRFQFIPLGPLSPLRTLLGPGPG